MGAHECHPRTVAASTHRCNTLLGRAPEYEALPAEQVELVDETYGNKIKRMQDSDQSLEAQLFLPGTYVYYWRKDKREAKGSVKGIARVHCTENRRDSERRRIRRTTSLFSWCTKARCMRVAQSSRTTNEGRSDTTRVWKGGSLPRIR